jgi:hypothetical protein
MSGKMTGPQKAATFMLAVGEEHASKLFAMMHEDEIRDISQAMASLGTVSAAAVEDLAREFTETIGQTGNLVGTWETTERMPANRGRGADQGEIRTCGARAVHAARKLCHGSGDAHAAHGKRAEGSA